MRGFTVFYAYGAHAIDWIWMAWFWCVLWELKRRSKEAQ